MYNYPGSGQYAQPPGAFAPPPGMAAPGVGPPPGMQQADNSQQPGPQARFPPNFQANMPNINFNAPVIRLGTTGGPRPPEQGGRRDGGGDRRPGLGAQDSRRHNEPMAAPLLPPTKDEVARTIFVGGITEGAGAGETMERILRAAGSLRRWTRATDGDDKPCRFGFAEYEDPDSLATAIEVLKDVEVPVKLRKPSKSASAGEEPEKIDDDDQEPEMSKLLIFVDDATMDYLQSYENSRGDVDSSQKQGRIDGAKQNLAGVIAELTNPGAHAANQGLSVGLDGDGDSTMQNGEHGAEVVTIPLNIDDELADIPAEMRETVAKEIAAFRERSNRRDLERLRREEEIEAQQSTRRGVSPPHGSASNSVPVGPRDKQVPNAPLGPKGFAGTQMPKDYQKNVAFVNGTGANGWTDREDQDTDADDEELEKRRKAKKSEEYEKEYLNQERKWLNRERSRTAAIEREKNRDKEEDEKKDMQKEREAKRLRDFNDEEEASRKSHDYYGDHSQWARSRASIRAREANLDDLDRAAEDRERARENQQHDRSRGVGDERQPSDLDSRNELRQEPQRFKLSLGAAAQKAHTQTQNKRTVTEVESLLEDDEVDESKTKRTLVPIKFDPADTRVLSAEEQKTVAQSLAAEIPKEDQKDALWSWAIPWDHLHEVTVSEKIRPWVGTKMLDILGVQDEFVADLVETNLKARVSAQDMMEKLEGAFDEDAERFVRGLWRRVIMYSESEKRGIKF